MGSCPVLQKFSREYTIECCFVVLGLSAGILCGSASISSQRCPQKCEQHDSLIVENINKIYWTGLSIDAVPSHIYRLTSWHGICGQWCADWNTYSSFS